MNDDDKKESIRPTEPWHGSYNSMLKFSHPL